MLFCGTLIEYALLYFKTDDWFPFLKSMLRETTNKSVVTLMMCALAAAQTQYATCHDGINGFGSGTAMIDGSFLSIINQWGAYCCIYDVASSTHFEHGAVWSAIADRLVRLRRTETSLFVHRV